VPGPITSSLSAAPLRLIEKGAKLVVSPDDVIKELGLKIKDLRKNKDMYIGLGKEEHLIIKLIENEPMQFDEIVRRLKIDSAKAGSVLSIMEIKGIVKNSGGSFSLN
jgi:DNA processing protein